MEKGKQPNDKKNSADSDKKAMTGESLNDGDAQKMADESNLQENDNLNILSKVVLLEESADDDYRERGFQQHCANKTLDALIMDFETRFKNQLDRINTDYTMSQQSIQKQLDELDSKTQKIEQLKKDYAGNTSILEKKIEPLQKKIEGLQQELYDSLKNYNDAKKELLEELEVKNRKDIKAEMDSISKNAQLLSEDYKKQNSEYLQKTNLVKKDFFDGLKSDLKKAKEELELIDTKIKAFNNSFINPSMNRVLWIISLGATGISGYFFSILAKLKNIDNTDQSDFLIELMFMFGLNFFDQENGIWQNLLYLGIILVAAAIVILLFFLLLNFIDKKVSYPLKALLSTPEQQRLKEQEKLLKSKKGFMQSYVSVLPAGIIVILVVLLFMFSSAYSGFSSDKINELTLSIAAHITGSSLALLFGGLLYIYISYALESRVSEIGQLKWKDYKELKFTIVLLVTSLLALPIMFLLPESDKFLVIFSSTMFVISLFAASMTIGHTMKFSSLLRVRERLKQEIEFISIFLLNIEHDSTVEDPFINQELLKQLRNLNADMLRELKQSFQDKSRSISQDYTPAIKHSQPKALLIRFWTNASKAFNSVFNRDDYSDKEETQPKEDSHQVSQTTPWEDEHYLSKDLLSDLYQQIKDKEKLIAESETELKTLKKNIDDIRHEKTEYQLALQNDIDNALKSKIELQERLLRLKKDNSNTIEKAHEKIQKIKLFLKQGYEMGSWYSENKQKHLCKY